MGKHKDSIEQISKPTDVAHIATGAGYHDDLATMSILSEPILVHELQARFNKNIIYTYVGDILVTVNPYQDVGLYSADNSALYRGVSRSAHPPHIFALANAAYTGLCQSRRSQVCVVSGESGAGKTETTKHIIKHVLELAANGPAGLQQRILQTNPILEAFGNAATVMNHNSSRFGKYLSVRFSAQSQPTGISVTEYLLERPRVARQAKGERSFHIFYYLVYGIDIQDRSELGLDEDEPEAYSFLSRTQPPPRDECTVSFKEVTTAFEQVGFENATVKDIMRVVSGVLLLGQIRFDNDGTAADGSIERGGNAASEAAAKVLAVEGSALRPALTTDVNLIRGESITKALSTEQSADNRDAAAKALYGRLFTWLVGELSKLIAPRSEESSPSLSLLDIFGFENFEVNSFEQLCINLANERLQFYFNEHIFAREQEEYAKEGINGVDVKYTSNEPLLQLFTGKPISLVVLLNEEARVRASTSTTLLAKIGDHLLPKHRDRLKTNAHGFVITHYAGPVEYHAAVLIAKNRDELPDAISACFHGSSNTLVKSLFADSASATAAKPRRATRRSMKRGPRTQKPTVSTQFCTSLDLLVAQMNISAPHFVRCIKPNPNQAPSQYEPDFVLRQLRYTGMLETIRIRREGYAVRLTFADFVARFGALAFNPNPSSKEHCSAIMKAADAKGFLLGKTKIFLKYWTVDHLAQAVAKLADSAIIVQKWVRRFLLRNHIKQLKAKAKEEGAQAGDFLSALTKTANRFLSKLEQVCSEDENRPSLAAAAVGAPGAGGGGGGGGISRAARSKKASAMKSVKKSFKPKGSLPDVGSKAYMKQSVNLAKQSRKWYNKNESKRVEKAAKDHNDGYPPMWFHDQLTRGQAEKRLNNRSRGDFLIRLCQSGPGYTISVNDQPMFRHYRIQVRPDLMYTLAGHSGAFVSLQALIAHFSKTPITKRGLTLLNPVKRPVDDPDAEVEYASVSFDGKTVIVTAPRSESISPLDSEYTAVPPTEQEQAISMSKHAGRFSTIVEGDEPLPPPPPPPQDSPRATSPLGPLPVPPPPPIVNLAGSPPPPRTPKSSNPNGVTIQLSPKPIEKITPSDLGFAYDLTNRRESLIVAVEEEKRKGWFGRKKRVRNKKENPENRRPPNTAA